MVPFPFAILIWDLLLYPDSSEKGTIKGLPDNPEILEPKD